MTSLSSLLVLPPPPTPRDRQIMSVYYTPSLTATLQDLSSITPPNSPPPILTIIFPATILRGPTYGAKQLNWSTTQTLLAHLYSIIAEVFSRKNLEVDVRVVPVDYAAKLSHPAETERAWSFRPCGVIVGDLRQFVWSFFPWDRIYRVASEMGNQVFKDFLQEAEKGYRLKHKDIIEMPGGLGLSLAGGIEVWGQRDGRNFTVVCIGGTFDHLHVGHKLLLTAGAMLVRVEDEAVGELVIGVTADDKLRNKKFAELIEPWDIRATKVLEFLASLLDMQVDRGEKRKAKSPYPVERAEGRITGVFRGGLVRVRIVAIYDGFGPTVTEEGMDALVVSGETREGGRAVNARRREMGWREMELYEVDVLEAGETEGEMREGYEGKVSSTAIRKGIARAREEDEEKSVS